MMVSRKKLEKIVREIYIELYDKATPSADFNKLVEEAKLNEFGQKVIDYDSYLISQELMGSIVDSICKKHRLNAYYKGLISRTVYLGCSPKFS